MMTFPRQRGLREEESYEYLCGDEDTTNEHDTCTRQPGPDKRHAGVACSGWEERRSER